MAVSRPWRTGLRPVPGSIALMALRWLLFVVAGLPSLAVAISGIGARVGSHTYFTEAPDPMPMVPLSRMLEAIPASISGILLVTALLVWFGNLMLTAGAVAIFGRTGSSSPRTLATVLESGSRSLGAYLRIAFVSLFLALLGTRLITLLSGRIMDHAREALWTLDARFDVQLLRVLATVSWLTVVGVFAWWCRVLVVADDRRRIRRTWLLVLRLWWRRPLSALVSHFLLALGTLLAGSWILFAWRQSPAGYAGWALLWLALLVALAAIWHWRLRAGQLLWSSDRFTELRSVPDEPWHLQRRIWRRLRRRRARQEPDVAPAEPSETRPDAETAPGS